MDIDTAIKERHSVRNYKDKKVRLEDITKILDSGRLAPSAGNINTIRFVVVSDKETKKDIAKASYSQYFISKAPFIIVVCSDLNRIKQAYGEHGLTYARQQAGASIQNMLLKAVSLKLSSCWIGAFNDSAIKKILKIPLEIQIEALLPIGYSDLSIVKRKKYDLDKIVHVEKWEE